MPPPDAVLSVLFTPDSGTVLGAGFSRKVQFWSVPEGKETRVLDGRTQVLEYPLRGDVALIKGRLADRWGNLVYHATARNYGPSMAMAAALTVAEVDTIVELGGLDPEAIITPGIFIDRVASIGGGRD